MLQYTSVTWCRGFQPCHAKEERRIPAGIDPAVSQTESEATFYSIVGLSRDSAANARFPGEDNPTLQGPKEGTLRV